MAFVNLSLLAGGLFVAVPVVLHLVMRREPRQLVFPALRFIKQRREANRRRLQLRHWLLLLLRCLAVAVPALALARPGVSSALLGNWVLIGLLGGLLVLVGGLGVATFLQKRSRALLWGIVSVAALIAIGLIGVLWSTLSSGTGVLIGDQQSPVAAVVVLDSSPRMEYIHQNQSRLRAAREIALWLLGQLPPDSQIAVLDSRQAGAVFSIDRSAARNTLERLEATGVPSPLIDVMEDAFRLAEKSSLHRREVYVLTDLNADQWNDRTNVRLKQLLTESPETSLCVIDVGVEQPRNFALGELDLSGQTFSRNSELRIATTLSRTGPAGSRTVELSIEEHDLRLPMMRDGQMIVPKSVRRNREIVEVPAGGVQTVEFRVRGLELGVHQGTVRLVSQDGLAVDDERYFTVEVQQAWPVLVVAPAGVETRFVTEAIAPFEHRETGQARFETTIVDQSDLPNQRLHEFDAICLLDPQPLTPAAWDRLAEYVKEGGGLLVALGHHAGRTQSFNDPAAQAVLGGQLVRQWRSGGPDLFVAPQGYDHPALREFRAIATSVPWQQFPVWRHWVIDTLAGNSQVVLPFSNNKPALIERSIGKGRVMIATTPVSDPLRPPGRSTWNELPTGQDAWPYFVLINEVMLHLVESRDARLNYLTGEPAELPNHMDRDPDRYLLFSPHGEPQITLAREGRLRVRSTDVPGAYRLKGNHNKREVIRGFCTNLPSSASRLERSSRQALDDVLGADRYQYARDRDEITRGVGEARAGREFFPYLMVMLVLVFGLEQALANRFYRDE